MFRCVQFDSETTMSITMHDSYVLSCSNYDSKELTRKKKHPINKPFDAKIIYLPLVFYYFSLFRSFFDLI